MNNFGEELAYWYLRLNGVFVLNDLVLHRAGLNGRIGNADVDLIAVRHPHAFEMVGMADRNDICEHLINIEPEIQNKTVAILAEVKTGASREITLNRPEKIRIRHS